MRLRELKPLMLLVPALLAGCGSSGTTTPIGGITLEQVAQVYEICTLSFVPEGAQPTVNLRERAFETENASVPRPQLAIDPDGEMRLAYTPREMFVQQDIRGRARIVANRVALDFDQRGSRSHAAVLLPNPLVLDFTSSPNSLFTSATPRYSVPRASYAQLAGVSEAGLADQIPGTLAAEFRAGGSCN